MYVFLVTFVMLLPRCVVDDLLFILSIWIELCWKLESLANCISEVFNALH